MLTTIIDDLPALGQSIDPPRRATPTLPPGLFPAAVGETVEKKTENTKPKIDDVDNIAEAVPQAAPLEAPKWPTIMEEKQKQTLAKPATPTKKQSPAQPLVATPVAKAKGKNPITKTIETVSTLLQEKQAAEETPKPDDVQPVKEITQPKIVETTTKRPHPGKLNIDTSPAFSREADSPVPYTGSINRSSRAPSISATSLGSRPGTPLATTIATGSPLKRTIQPRTLRITDTPKTETPPVLPTPTAATVATPPLPTIANTASTKIVSRRTSIASLNPPGTPMSELVDTMSVTSTSVSRANSPPPMGTKKVKKEKKPQQKRKEKEAEVASLLSKEPAEQIAPIMARKTKSKKSKPASSGPTPAPKRTPQPVVEKDPFKEKEKAEVPASIPDREPPASPVKASKVQEPRPASKGKARAPSSTPTPATPPPPGREHEEATVKPEQVDKNSPKPLSAATILQALESTHQLAISTLSLLKPLTSQSELKKLGIDPFTTADLQNHIEQLRYELTKADEQLLKQGQAVRKDLGAEGPGAGRASGRSLITPHGTRLGCLTKEEEERYLVIEQRVMAEKGISKWGAGPKKYQHAMKHTPSKKIKLQNALAQEDVLKALSVATESLEEAMRDAAKGGLASNIDARLDPAAAHLAQQTDRLEAHLGPAPVHLAQQTMPQPGRNDSQPQDFAMDAREFVNKFVPRLLDPSPHTVAVPPHEDDTHSEVETPVLPERWQKLQPPPGAATLDMLTPQLIADAAAAAGLAQPPNLNLPTSHASAVTSAQAMDTLREAMATAGAIAKLGATECLNHPSEVLKTWDRAMAQTAAAGVASGSRSSQGAGARGAGSSSGRGAPLMSVADLERESMRERAAEARREALEQEKKFNRLVKANRKLVLGTQGN